MLERDQVYVGPTGDLVTILYQNTEAIGSIYWASRAFGPLTVGVSVTEQGLVEAGYELQSSE